MFGVWTEIEIESFFGGRLLQEVLAMEQAVKEVIS